MSARGVFALTLLALIAGCSSPAGSGDDAGADASDAGGPTWLDSSPAHLGDDAEAAADVETSDALEAAAPACEHAGSCGGSWLRYECPRAFTPPADAHCTLNEDADAGPDAGVTREWCCYGAVAP